MNKIILLISTLFFSLSSFSQVKDKEVLYKTDATLPPTIETFKISWGNFMGKSITADSLKLLTEEKVKVKDNATGQYLKIEKIIFTYIKYHGDPHLLSGMADTLTAEMKSVLQGAATGDIYYIEANYTKEKEKKSSIMAIVVK